MTSQNGGAPPSIPPLDKLLEGLSESAAVAGFSQAMELPTMVLSTPDTVSPLRFLHVNEAFVSLTGFQFSDAVGETTAILQGEDTDIDAARAFRRDMERDGNGFTTLVYYRKNGMPYEVFLLGARVKEQTVSKAGASSIYAVFAYFIRDADDVAPRQNSET